jgi:hypothetical protein
MGPIRTGGQGLAYINISSPQAYVRNQLFNIGLPRNEEENDIITVKETKATLKGDFV